MILFVRAQAGCLDFISAYQHGVVYPVALGADGLYHAEIATFAVEVAPEDGVKVTLDGAGPTSWSLCNDMHRFIFPNQSAEQAPEGGVVEVQVEERILTRDRVG